MQDAAGIPMTTTRKIGFYSAKNPSDIRTVGGRSRTTSRRRRRPALVLEADQTRALLPQPAGEIAVERCGVGTRQRPADDITAVER
jgi:hypothetical protein